MIDSTSFTSEPQYQRPDNRTSDIDFVPKEPLVITPPPSRTVTAFDYDINFPRRLLDKLGRGMLICNRMDFYANTVILGSFCFAITFIVWGFYRCRVVRVNDTFLWSMILLFGGIGEVTAGFLEYLKGRVWPYALYLTFGFFCLSMYGLYVIPEWFGITYNMSMLYNFSSGSLTAFMSGWVVIVFGLLLCSVASNLFFALQVLTILISFLLWAIGEGSHSYGTKRIACGILMVISGFISLYICITQIINNQTFYSPLLPCLPLGPNGINGIDYPAHPSALITVNPVTTVTPVVPATPVAVAPIAAATPVAPVV